MKHTKETLKHAALSHSLFSFTSLAHAVRRLTFIQIDPIRSPARAQDLILRHRVTDYRVGDIEEQYPSLGLEEDYLYAHGYMVREIWQLLHPRKKITLTAFDIKVLEKIRELGEVHPTDLVLHFKPKRVISWWGVHARATSLALNRLHYFGLIRVTKRKKGIRFYQAFTPQAIPFSLHERLAKLIIATAGVMAPVSYKTLQESLHRLRRHFGDTKKIITQLVKTGELEQQVIDGIPYVWPAQKVATNPTIDQKVRFLSPFDPVVRDRVRFNHLWGWPYQFEAYVPAHKRIRGYYAMPLLWGTDMIGWGNIAVKNSKLSVDVGCIKARPSSKQFSRELEKEIARMKSFLKLP